MLSKISLLLSACLLTTAVFAADHSLPQQIERGNYLVNAIAGCGDCHSPRLSNGAPDKDHWLQGAPLFFAPVHPIPNWATQAPAIAGLPYWKADEIVKLLETGSMPNGARPNPPMPGYRMTPADARAVVAYLKSLAAGK